MHISPEVLLDLSQRFVEKRVDSQRSIIAAYLRGSLVYGSPLLGGAGDIDIVFIHSSPPEVAREIEQLIPEIHYDIENHDQLLYREPRQLRVHPWLGTSLYDAKILHDPQHFLDYVQAGVRSVFFQPENILRRAESELEGARQFWLNHQLSSPFAGPKEVGGYLSAVERAVNTVALLSGPALPTRRLGLDFPERAEAVGKPEFYQGFLGLVGGISRSTEALRKWLPLWAESLDALTSEICPVNLHPQRRDYYQKSLEALLGSEEPSSMLWPLLKTWTQAASALPEDHASVSSWARACDELGLYGDKFPARLRALDAYLDSIEDVLNTWALERGASSQ